MLYCKPILPPTIFTFFFFNDTATTEIYTLSLHDALPISPISSTRQTDATLPWCASLPTARPRPDRKSTRLNSSHQIISYAVFCLKKKKQHARSERTNRTDNTKGATAGSQQMRSRERLREN